MRALIAIARNTFHEAIRDRVLYLFLGFGVLLLASSKLFGMLTVGDEAKVIKDLGLAGIQLFGMLIAVMLSVLMISREIDDRTVYNILAKPVARWQFLLGKYLGLVMTVAVNLTLMALLLLAVVALFGGGFEPRLLVAVVMTFLELALLAAFGVLFAVVTKPMLGSVMTLAVFVIGHVTRDLWLVVQHVPSEATRIVVATAYYLLPNLERFNFRSEAVHGLPIPVPAIGWALLYGLAYTALVLVLACLRLAHRDLA